MEPSLWPAAALGLSRFGSEGVTIHAAEVVVNGSRAFLIFDGVGGFTGSTGCAPISGAAVLARDRVTVSVSGTPICSGSAIDLHKGRAGDAPWRGRLRRRLADADSDRAGPNRTRARSVLRVAAPGSLELSRTAVCRRLSPLAPHTPEEEIVDGSAVQDRSLRFVPVRPGSPVSAAAAGKNQPLTESSATTTFVTEHVSGSPADADWRHLSGSGVPCGH